MPYIRIKDKDIYYKEYGQGEPVIFLSGVMMSTSSWSPFINIVSKDYRMITVDLIDQGRSSNGDSSYTIDVQVEILKKVVDELKLENINLVGMSYGGKVALAFTVKYQDRVKSLTVSNTDCFTTKIMSKIAEGWYYAASTLDGSIFATTVFPYIYSYNYYEENFEDMEEKERILSKIIDEEWYLRFKRVLKSAMGYSIYDKLNTIKVPTLIISSELDILTPIKCQEYIHKGIEGSKWVIIKDAGHGVMFEKPKEYITTIMDFINNI